MMTLNTPIHIEQDGLVLHGKNTASALERIIGGFDIGIEQAPYQVNYGDLCGGVLIHPMWVLTTAHCGKDLRFIRVGNKYHLKGNKVKISRHYIHPDFGKAHTYDYDIQLLKLKRALRFHKYVKAIKISEGIFGSKIFVAGWGYIKEKGDYNSVLRQVIVPYVPMKECQQIESKWYNHSLTDRMFCAGGGSRDSCQGDSGGAAVSLARVIGLSSFGFGCGRGYPGVYTNVSEPSIRQWIEHIARV